MAGLLDGPLGANYLDQLQANFNPRGYEAYQQGQQRNAVYNMLLQRGATPEMAAGMASSPQAFGMGGGALMPQAPQLIQTQTPFGETVFNWANPVSKSGQPSITPGTISPVTPSEGKNASGESKKPSNTINALAPIIDTIRTMQQSGASRSQIVESLPTDIRDMVRGLLTGQFKLSSIPARSAQQKLAVEAVANTMGLDEGVTAARDRFTKDYGDTKGGLGYRLERGDAMLQHLKDAVESYGGLHTSSEIGGVPNWLTGTKPTEFINERRNLSPEQQKYIGSYQNGIHTYSLEKGGFLGGPSGGTESERASTRENLGFKTPRDRLIGSLEAEVNVLEGKYKAMDADKARAFQADPEVGNKFGVYTPERQAKINEIRQAIEKLKGGVGSNPSGGIKPEIRYDRQGNAFVRGPDGNPVPYRP